VTAWSRETRGAIAAARAQSRAAMASIRSVEPVGLTPAQLEQLSRIAAQLAETAAELSMLERGP
jgi:hypothetical protein